MNSHMLYISTGVQLKFIVITITIIIIAIIAIALGCILRSFIHFSHLHKVLQCITIKLHHEVHANAQAQIRM